MVVEQLTFRQLDPTAAVAPSADLVAWPRLGDTYQPALLQQALERHRTLFEHRFQEVETEPAVANGAPDGEPRPLSGRHGHLLGNARRLEWLAANDGFRCPVLDLLSTSGPLPSRDIPDTASVPWVSTGWTNNRKVTQLLEFLPPVVK